MLTKENIEALLKIDTKNKSDNRYLRLMSCDNPIKDLYVYHLKEIREEFNECPKHFDRQLALCTYKFILTVESCLNGNEVPTYLKNCATPLSKELIRNALSEILTFYKLLVYIQENDAYDSEYLYRVSTFKIPNYVALLEMCGILDVSNNIYRSKFLARFLNIKDQVQSYNEEKMSRKILDSEFKSHIEYITEQFSIIAKFNMSEEDILAFLILFDIRHYKHNRKSRVYRNT